MAGYLNNLLPQHVFSCSIRLILQQRNQLVINNEQLLITNPWLMELTNLSAVSPIDGRYRKQVNHLDEYFSEYALIKYRVLVEIE